MQLPAQGREASLTGPLEEEGVTGQVSFEWVSRTANTPGQERSQTVRKSTRLESVDSHILYYVCWNLVPRTISAPGIMTSSNLQGSTHPCRCGDLGDCVMTPATVLRLAHHIPVIDRDNYALLQRRKLRPDRRISSSEIPGTELDVPLW